MGGGVWIELVGMVMVRGWIIDGLKMRRRGCVGEGGHRRMGRKGKWLLFGYLSGD